MRKRAINLFSVFVALVLLTACSSGGGPGSETTAPDSGNPGDSGASQTFATAAEVIEAVKAAGSVSKLPDAVAASLAKPDEAGPKGYFDCKSVDDAGTGANPYGQCAYGDKKGTKLMVVYGDSRAAMWGATLTGVAAKNGWQLRVFGLGGCPVVDLQFQSYQTKAPNTKCDTYHQSAVSAIAALKPNLIITTSVSNQRLVDGSSPTPQQWADGWKSTFTKLAPTGARLAMLGDIPTWENSDARCLAAHVTDIQKCASAVDDASKADNLAAERAAAEGSGAIYIPTLPWVCAEKCEPVIADKRVYNNQFHFTQSYAVYLTGAVAEALAPALA